MMVTRRIQLILFAAVLLLAGCGKSPSAKNASSASSPASKPAPSPSLRTTARIHWLGMTRLSRETNAASLMAVWNLPESRPLEQQTLDKLSQAPWRLLHESIDPNAAAWLRPLLDNVVSNESCLEIRGATHQPDALAFAIRLSDQRAALWQTNLARVLASLTGIHPMPAPDHHYGWSLKKHDAPNLIELTRVGPWTIVGAAQDQNPLVAELKSRIQHGRSPVTVGNSNDWLAVDLNPARLIPGLATLNSQLSTLNQLFLSVTGDGSNVLTHARADFSRPLALELQPWNVPTNLVDRQLCSFTALRGLRPWLKSVKAWNDLQIGPLPDQIYFWAAPISKKHSYFAAPLPDAGNEVARFTDWVLQNQGRCFPTNALLRFVRSKGFNGLQWKGVPYLWPFLRAMTNGHRNFVYAGSFPNANTRSISGKWLGQILGGTNLVYYDSEATGMRVGQWIFMSQFARVVSHHAQLSTQSPALPWLTAIAPRLGYSVTHVIETGPNQLSFTRRSSIGLTGIELNLLVDWLESPEFPIGLHTFLAPPPQY